jgi:hypothetical protein
MRTCLFLVLLALPTVAYAQIGPAPKSPADCPVVDTSTIQKNMGAMMDNMGSMMADTSDSGVKTRMQKMHNQMVSMTTGMRKWVAVA